MATHEYTAKDIARFWSNVDKSGGEDGCWIWTGTRVNFGYGRMWFKKTELRTHRISYELAFGEIPNGLCVLHKCDNPSCVNPLHLFLGTLEDNVRDRVQKHRGAYGEANGVHTHPERMPRFKGSTNCNSKLTETDIPIIRQRYEKGRMGYIRLGREYGVSGSTIRYIISRKTWRHVV